MSLRQALVLVLAALLACGSEGALAARKKPPAATQKAGTQIMDEIRMLIDRMAARERQLLDIQSRAAADITRRGMLTLGLGILLTLVILGGAAVTLINACQVFLEILIDDLFIPLVQKVQRKMARTGLFAVAAIDATAGKVKRESVEKRLGRSSIPSWRWAWKRAM